MASEKIKEYIEKTKKAGYNDEQIKSSLKKAGWNDAKISEAMGKQDNLDLPAVPLKQGEEQQPQPSETPSTSSSPSTSNKTNTMAIIALILAFFIPLFGIIFGIIALVQIKKSGEKGKGLAIAAIVIPVVLVVTLGSMFFFFSHKVKTQCGEDGALIGSANHGYYCGYHSVCEDCQNTSQCPDCSQLCESKDKVERDGLCGPKTIDLSKIKRDSDGNYTYVDEGPVNCYCCCEEKVGE